MILAANIFSSSNNEDLEAPWLQNPWGKDTVASTKNIMNKGNFVFGHNMRVIKSGVSNFVILNRYNFYRASVEL